MVFPWLSPTHCWNTFLWWWPHYTSGFQSPHSLSPLLPVPDAVSFMLPRMESILWHAHGMTLKWQKVNKSSIWWTWSPRMEHLIPRTVEKRPGKMGTTIDSQSWKTWSWNLAIQDWFMIPKDQHVLFNLLNIGAWKNGYQNYLLKQAWTSQ